jgi:hypothetical protein
MRISSQVYFLEIWPSSPFALGIAGLAFEVTTVKSLTATQYFIP